MTFSDEQVTKLRAPLDRKNVRERKQGGRMLSYIEGWQAIAEANAIFGFDRWSRETFDVMCVGDAPREIGDAKVPGFGVTYICRVRIVVDGQVIREGCGAGHGIDRDRGLAHESAIKEAETDAMKRALMTFGNPFGLALYDKEQREVIDEAEVQRAAEVERRKEEFFAMREDYIRGCKEHIEEFGSDWPKLFAWWTSPEQKAAHQKYLSPAELEELKALLLTKRPKQEGTA